MTEDAPLVLVVEDEPQMRRFLRATLNAHGYRLVEAESAAQALAHATAHNPDLVLLDLGLPDGDGLDVTKRLREWSVTPIVVISARGQENDKIAALDAGADDYLTKPFGTGELLARMRVALRHAEQGAGDASEPSIDFGDVSVDRARRRVTRRGEEVHLTPREYRLLLALARHAGRVMTHQQLLKEVWGPNSVRETHYLRVYMAQLRHKLEDDPARPNHLMTEPGVGYRLRTE
jgi:two-component system, OmpR family, KDP operon response regulator KdpE